MREEKVWLLKVNGQQLLKNNKGTTVAKYSTILNFSCMLGVGLQSNWWLKRKIELRIEIVQENVWPLKMEGP